MKKISIPKSRFFMFFGYKRFFTLLEIMIALVLLAAASSIIGIRISKALEEKQFQSAACRLQSELEASRRDAFNMQADWTVFLEKKGDHLSLRRSCFETDQATETNWKCPAALLWNHKTAPNISLLFSSTGKIEPGGIIELAYHEKCVAFPLMQMFSIAEGSDGSMPRPDGGQSRVE